MNENALKLKQNKLKHIKLTLVTLNLIKLYCIAVNQLNNLN